MRNNLQNDVKTEKPLGKVSKFNLSGSLSNTHTLGEVTVAFSRLLQPGTKSVCGVENLIYLAPLAAPTYAKQHYKTWHQFCPIEDVWANYSAFMTQKSISRNGVTFTPTKVPSIRKNELSVLTLNGCKMTMYLADVTSSYSGTMTDAQLMEMIRTAEFYDLDAGEVYKPNGEGGFANDDLVDLVDNILSPYYIPQSATTPSIFNVADFLGMETDSIQIFLANMDEKRAVTDTYVSFMRGKYSDGLARTLGVENEAVSLQGADYVLYGLHTTTDETPKTYLVALACRLSSWGVHLQKILRGLGYGIDFDDAKEVTILPLLATYKMYWDVFGLEMWQNFESTYCGRVISYITNNDIDQTVFDDNDVLSIFTYFIFYELGSMWLTEQNDYVSAHLPQPVIATANHTPLYGVADVYGALSPSGPANNIALGGGDEPNQYQPDETFADGHAYYKSIYHGHLDDEILKRMYKRVNTNTALGRNIARLMRSQGLGTYMERTKVYYIGDTNVDIDVSSVVSQSDTFENGGKMLGSRAGKGVGYGSTEKKLHYENDSLGWWIALEAITCDSGYSQGEDQTLEALTLEKMYQPDYEGLGLALHSKAIVNGSRAVSFNAVGLSAPRTASSSPLGFAPRMSEYKVGRSCLNGGFANRSTEQTFVPYILDKLIYPDNLVVDEMPKGYTPVGVSVPDGSKVYRSRLDLPLEDVPIAGTAWRYLNRFAWLANLNRCFANVDPKRLAITWSGSTYGAWGQYVEFLPRIDDNYISLSEIWFKAWSHMLPIEETYGTIDPDEKELQYIDRV